MTARSLNARPLPGHFHLALGLLLAVSAAEAAEPAKEASREVASYQLQARLDEKAHRIDGRGTISFVNRSPLALHELWFHLYLNAFENERTLYLRGPTSRSGRRLSHPGSICVLRLTRRDAPETDLWAAAAPHSPADPRDRTDIRVPLAEPLARGARLELAIEFVAQLPEVIERTGFVDDFHLVAQWFPKLARLEPNGQFAHFAFHPFAEFFADFGSYRVELDVPETHVVGSTGQLRLLGKSAGRSRYLAEARDVHDFAWVSAPELRVETRTIDGISVRLLAAPKSERSQRAIWQTVESALPLYDRLYGHYPYPTLSIVHPPLSAGPAGGMEYPTFFTVGEAAWVSTLGARWVESVTAHELGHQWFYGLLGSDETRHPFLDEGLTSHAEWLALEHAYGASAQLNWPWLPVSRAATGRYLGLGYGAEERIDQPARDFPSFRALAGQVYGRTALFLETLRRVYGERAYDAALARYTQAQWLGHPRPEDLYDALSTLEPQAGAAAREWFEHLGQLNFRLGPLETRPRKGPQKNGQGGAPSGSPGFSSSLVVFRSGAIQLPLELSIRFEDGSEQRRRLAAPRPREVIRFEHATAVAEVHLDPEQKLLIDEDLRDQRWRRSRPWRASAGARVPFVTQLLLRLLSP